MTLTQERSANIRWWVLAGAQAQRNREVLRRLKLDKDRIVADTARAALDGLRLYRRLLELPENGLASLAHRLIERRQRG